MIRCKFTCVSVTKRKGWGDHEFVYDAEFNAVHGTSHENAEFFAATPSGNLKVSTIRNDTFEVGKDYYLDLQVAP